MVLYTSVSVIIVLVWAMGLRAANLQQGCLDFEVGSDECILRCHACRNMPCGTLMQIGFVP